jgi:thioredoxin reductase (NADPH)
MRPDTAVTGVSGQDHLAEITLRDVTTGRQESVAACALFICIGAVPCTDWLAGVVERDEHGFVVTGLALLRDGKRPAGWRAARDPFLLEASVPGVFAAGDVRAGSVKRVAAAVGEGAITVHLVHQYRAGL